MIINHGLAECSKCKILTERQTMMLWRRKIVCQYCFDVILHRMVMCGWLSASFIVFGSLAWLIGGC